MGMTVEMLPGKVCEIIITFMNQKQCIIIFLFLRAHIFQNDWKHQVIYRS